MIFQTLAALAMVLGLIHCVSAQPSIAHSSVLAPALSDFGFKDVADVLNNLDSLPKIGPKSTLKICISTKISTETDLLGNDYYLVQDCKRKFTFFEIARMGHGLLEIYGPLKPRLISRHGNS